MSASNAAYAAVHRDEKAVYNSAYCASHKGERLVYLAAHREEIKAQSVASGVAYRKSHREELRERAAQKCAEFTERLQILRTVNGCEDCETHEGRLEHHHIDPDTKRYCISEMNSCSLDTLEDELGKCVVLCRLCHRKRHRELEAACL